ncbi:2-methylisoborneol synthase [Prauserella shujinwangii]|uniref:Terpene synthase n=1 Tax=Prauserella shujinwangii TaxID=1453103 RepID=A0A2T0LNW4_9PSEU|nr:terpene synthase [Prauserella shujinwangii]PRX44940.1 2-methylisoborneol synthase [Prauserella shujinwangii]
MNHHPLSRTPKVDRPWPEAAGGVPPLACPFPLEVDEAAAAETDEKITKWIDGVGILQGQRNELNGFRLGTFAALVHPRSASRDHLFFAAQNIATLFAIDDHFCDEEVEGAVPELTAARLAGVLPALENPRTLSRSLLVQEAPQTDPVTSGIRETVAHAARLGSTAQVGRLRREYLAMCLAMAGESAFRLAGRTPTTSDYVIQRPYNGAMACLAVADIVGGYEVSANEYDTPQVRALTLAASSLILHANDLYSAAKESVTHGVGTNLPELLAADRGGTLQQGMLEVARLHNRQMDNYLVLEAEVAKNASPGLTRYLLDLRSWIRGSLEWHALTGRYHQRAGRPTPDSYGVRSPTVT